MNNTMLNNLLHLTFQTFNKALDYCIQNRVISNSGDLYSLGEDTKLQYLLRWATWPALTTLLKAADVMTQVCTYFFITITLICLKLKKVSYLSFCFYKMNTIYGEVQKISNYRAIKL